MRIDRQQGGGMWRGTEPRGWSGARGGEGEGEGEEWGAFVGGRRGREKKGRSYLQSSGGGGGGGRELGG